MSDVCAVCNRELDAACRDYHCPTNGAQAAVAASGLASLTDRVTPPQPDIRLVLEQLPHALPGGLIGNTVEQGPPYNLYEPRARIAAAFCRNGHVSVFEFGALLGYGVIAVATRIGMERVRIGWCDNESHTPGSNETCVENVESRLPAGGPWYVADRHDSVGFGHADVALVDGDHSFEATMDDLAYAYWLRPRLIFVDDHIPEHHGVMLACSTIRDPKVRIPTVNGLVVVWPWTDQVSSGQRSQEELQERVERCGLEWEEI